MKTNISSVKAGILGWMGVSGRTSVGAVQSPVSATSPTGGKLRSRKESLDRDTSPSMLVSSSSRKRLGDSPSPRSQTQASAPAIISVFDTMPIAIAKAALEAVAPQMPSSHCSRDEENLLDAWKRMQMKDGLHSRVGALQKRSMSAKVVLHQPRAALTKKPGPRPGPMKPNTFQSGSSRGSRKQLESHQPPFPSDSVIHLQHNPSFSSVVPVAKQDPQSGLLGLPTNADRLLEFEPRSPRSHMLLHRTSSIPVGSSQIPNDASFFRQIESSREDSSGSSFASNESQAGLDEATEMTSKADDSGSSLANDDLAVYSPKAHSLRARGSALGSFHSAAHSLDGDVLLQTASSSK